MDISMYACTSLCVILVTCIFLSSACFTVQNSSNGNTLNFKTRDNRYDSLGLYALEVFWETWFEDLKWNIHHYRWKEYHWQLDGLPYSISFHPEKILSLKKWLHRGGMNKKTKWQLPWSKEHRSMVISAHRLCQLSGQDDDCTTLAPWPSCESRWLETPNQGFPKPKPKLFLASF